MNKQTLLIVALLLSVSANLLIAGIFLGRLGGPPSSAPPMAWAASKLQPELGQKVRRRMRAQAGEVRPLRQSIARAMAEVRKTASAEPFEAKALDRALAQWRSATSDYQAFIHENLVEVSADLPREQRMALLRAAMLRGQGQTKTPRQERP